MTRGRKTHISFAPGCEPYLAELLRIVDEAEIDQASSVVSMITAGLTPMQLDAVLCREKMQVWSCGRRCGKTTALGRVCLKTASESPRIGEDDSIIAYCAPTKNQARRLMWGRLEQAVKDIGIEDNCNATELIVTLNNRAQIWLMGLDNDRDVDRLRGFAYRAVVIDEAQSVTADFDNLVEDVISPALADFGGKLILSGTPNASCIGYFHDAANGIKPGWAPKHWTVLDNNEFPQWRYRNNWQEMAREYLDSIRKSHGWDISHPTYQREWLGRWVRDNQALVYDFDPARNVYDSLPAGKYSYVMGVDFGMDDAFSCVVWAYTDHDQCLYEVDTYLRSGLSVSGWADKIKERIERYHPAAIVGDTGGLGKAIVVEMNTRFGLPIKPAEKTAKASYIEIMNDNLRLGRVKVRRGSPLTRTWSLLQWDDAHKREDPRTPNDDADAGLYGFREALHWTSRPAPAKIEPGSVAWANAIEAKMFGQRMQNQSKPRRW